MIEIEEAVLSMIINNTESLIIAMPKLKYEYFTDIKTKSIFLSIREMYEEHLSIDILSLVVRLRKNQTYDLVGGAYYVTTLTSQTSGNLGLNSHLMTLSDLYKKRELQKLVLDMSHEVNSNKETDDILESMSKKSLDLLSEDRTSIKKLNDVYEEMIGDIMKSIDTGNPVGIETGLSNLDQQTGGWQNGNLIIIASRPAMGKTAMALHLAKIPALKGLPVAIFSLEMTSKELVGRLASSESNISSTLINQKRINNYDIANMNHNCSKLINSPIYIDDSSSLSISDIRAKAKSLHYEYGVKLIIIDYLQLMKGQNEGNREQEISSISRGLKQIAKELDIPIIALSQLSRRCEERTDKRPLLSDLRESGSIEQDADIVCFLFRPEYYGMNQDGYKFGDTILETKGLLLFDIAKGRGLQTGEIPLRFNGQYMTVSNYNYF
jgi:replicative DNA helicase